MPWNQNITVEEVSNNLTVANHVVRINLAKKLAVFNR
jgi:hypothetical protein